MNTSDFIQKINAALKKNHIPAQAVSSGNAVFLYPKFKEPVSVRIQAGETSQIRMDGVTKTLATEQNLAHILGHIQNGWPIYGRWLALQAAYKKTSEYRERVRLLQFENLAEEAGLHPDEHGGYTRGDHFELITVQFVWRKADLRRYHASGKFLGLVAQRRKRVYAKSCKWRPSVREDLFVVGQNETGTAFCHQVPSSMETLDKALSWIWGGKTIEARQGDIATTAGQYKNVDGKPVEGLRIIDSHRVTGEVYVNGFFHVRNARIYHEKGQHPDIIVGNEWKRILIGRRSERGMSSAD